MGTAFRRRVSDKNRLALFTWHLPQMCFASLLTGSCRHIPGAAIHTTSKLGCIFRRKLKPQLLDTATVVTTCPYVTQKRWDVRLGKNHQLQTLSTERLSRPRFLWDHSSFQLLMTQHPTPEALLLLPPLSPSPKPSFHLSLHALAPPARTETPASAHSSDSTVLAPRLASKHRPLPRQRSKTRGSCLSFYGQKETSSL